MMKHKVLVLMTAAVTGMLVLTACTSSENVSTQSPSSQNTSNTQSGSQSVSGIQVSQSDAVESFDLPEGINGDTSAPGTVSGGEAGTTGSGTGDGTAAQGGPVEDGGPVGDVIPDEDAAAAENDTSDPASEGESEIDDQWAGTYVGEEETVTITRLDEDTISFVFTEAGISGTATLNGYQAVYKGDDYHDVVFNLDKDTIDVTVSSEEDYDSSESPLIGHYVREPEQED